MEEKPKPEPKREPRAYPFYPGDFVSYGTSTLGSAQQRAALMDYLYWRWRETHGD